MRLLRANRRSRAPHYLGLVLSAVFLSNVAAIEATQASELLKPLVEIRVRARSPDLILG